MRIRGDLLSNFFGIFFSFLKHFFPEIFFKIIIEIFPKSFFKKFPLDFFIKNFPGTSLKKFTARKIFRSTHPIIIIIPAI